MLKNGFSLKKDGQEIDYLKPDRMDLGRVRQFFESKGYQVIKVTQPHRNVVGELDEKGQRYHFKLAGSAGMNILVENEIKFNRQINQLVDRENAFFWVPKVIETGIFQPKDTPGGYVYFVSEHLDGQLLVDYPSDRDTDLIKQHLDQIIDTAEAIVSLNLDLNLKARSDVSGYLDYFIHKTTRWYEAVPDEVKNQYQLKQLLNLVKTNAGSLRQSSRHGDFAPWHLLIITNGKLGLLDAEHATSEGIEYYDIAYFIQRVWQVLKDETLAKEIHQHLINRGYDVKKLRTVLASRAIGGFLDEAIGEKNYQLAGKFGEWVVNS